MGDRTPAPETSLQAKGMRPLLSVSTSLPALPVWHVGVRDPAVLPRIPTDDGDAVAIMYDIKNLRGDLQTARGERRTEIYMLLTEGYAAMSYYLEDAIAGRVRASGSRQKMASNLQGMRLQLQKYAGLWAKSAKSKADQARAAYHAAMTQYVRGERRGAAANLLRGLQKAPLNGYLKRRTEFAVAMHDLDYGSQSRRRAARAKLTGLIGSMPLEGAVAARLLVARYDAGVNRNGHAAGSASKSYRGFLWGASKRVATFSESQKADVLTYSIAVWRKAEPSGSWAKPPFPLSMYGHQATTVAALIERGAISDWSQGRTALAVKKYRGIAKEATGSATKGDMDLRILDLEQTRAAKTRRPSIYEKALISAHREYADPAVLGDGNEDKARRVAATIRNRHAALVKAAIATAKKSRSARAGAIRMAETYLQFIDDNVVIENTRADIANLYALAGQHATAVDIYRQLAETSTTGNARKYMLLAIASQSVLADWPTKAPWDKIPAGDATAREDLQAMYQRLAQESQKTDWFVISHTGLLHIALGRPDAAFADWEKALAAAPRGADAARAAGYMLQAYHQASSWDSLENLSRLVIEKKVAANHKGRRINAVAMLATALLEGGKENIASQEFAKAVKRLAEFVKSFKKHKRHDEGMFYLAEAYRGDGQHRSAVKTLLTFVEQYPRSQFYRDALKRGGDWSMAMAYESNTIFFYRRFIRSFKEDEATPVIRTDLVDLFLGRQYYGDAIAILKEQAEDRRSDAATKESAYHQILDTEVRNGSVKRAVDLAKTLVKSASISDVTKADSYRVLARVAGDAGQKQQVLAVARQLEGLSQASFEEQDALAEARFILGKMESKGVAQELFNLGLKDPYGSLNKQYAKYKQARSRFDSVCEAGQTSYCAPALHELARLSEEFLRSLEDIAIQETLAKSVVDRFENRKQAILNEVASTAQNADAKSMEIAAEGTTDPNWTGVIFWHNSSEWAADRVSGEAGNGYLQFAAFEDESL